jgi:hypothetical protein
MARRISKGRSGGGVGCRVHSIPRLYGQWPMIFADVAKEASERFGRRVTPGAVAKIWKRRHVG